MDEIKHVKAFSFPQLQNQVDFVPHTHLLSKMMAQEDGEKSASSVQSVPLSKPKHRTFPVGHRRRPLHRANAIEQKVSDVSELTQQPRLDSYPYMEVSLFYEIQSQKLQVTLHQACNLPAPAEDHQATSNPYITLYLEPNRKEVFRSTSQAKSSTRDPVFDEKFQFSISLDQVMHQILILKVCNSDKCSKNGYIGAAQLQLCSANLLGVKHTVLIDEKLLPSKVSLVQSKKNMYSMYTS